MSPRAAEGRLSVFVVAPTPALRAGLRSMLEQAGMDVSGEAAELPDSHIPGDVLLLSGDGLLQDASGLNMPAVLLSDDNRQAAALRTLGLPGWGLLPANAGAGQLVAAVNAAGQGLVVIAGDVSILVSGQSADTADPLQEPLTPRELEVLQLVSHGLPNKLIARQLGISEHTVKFHVSSTYAKLGAGSRTEAVSLAARRGLISL